MPPSVGTPIAPARRAAMNRALLRWYGRNGRDLDFRRTRDPWAVLVAEVMLQQTQASRVGPTWRAFLVRFPTAADLAAASPADAIRAWAGLGYNGRAVRLGRTARTLVADHGGRVPADSAVLQLLPGIGPYTARAVSAIAFDRPVAAVDTNVDRVVRRVFGLGGGAAGSSDVQRLADGWVARRRAAAWTHAMMDVGATLCRPRDPLCDRCPLRGYCGQAAAGSASAARPRAALARRRTLDAGMPFAATRRWLRGRLLARLREQDHGRWLDVSGPLGGHSAASVGEALEQLANDGLVERDRFGRARLPLHPA